MPVAEPRPELIALLDAVKDHPDDDTPRLVLADWLDEQDNRFDAERARFIRRDVARARGGGAGQPVPDQVRRDDDELRARWLAPFKPFITGWSVERGLPHLAMEGPSFLNPEFQALLPTEAFAFVQFIRLSGAGGPRMEAAVALPGFQYVPGVSLHPFSAFGADSAARFFSSPNLAGLRQLEFRGIRPGAVGTHALAANPALARLRKLLLAHNQLVDKAVGVLAATTHLTNIEVLDLSDNNIGDKGAEALAASTAFPNLRELNLRINPRLTAHGKRPLRDAFGDRVHLD
ncbi:MAG TPA: TIGR02996 domain-containing protein [Gemmata sp.]